MSDVDDGLQVNQKPLKHNHALFVQAYLLTNNAAESVRRIGYTGKNARIMGYKLVNNPRIKAEIQRFQAKQTVIVTDAVEQKLTTQLKTITKDDFVAKALSDYESLDVKEPNRMRALDLAGRGAGILGNNAPVTNNNTQINIKGDVTMMSAPDKWAALRALMENE